MYVAQVSPTFVVPEDTYYIRATLQNRTDTVGTESMIVEAETLPDKYIPFGERSFFFTHPSIYKDIAKKVSADLKITTFLEGKKWAVVGDSITANGRAYHQQLKDRVSNLTIYNHSTSGARIEKVEGYMCMAEEVDRIPDDVDIITIAGGTNWSNGGDDDNSQDITNVRGAMNILLNKLKVRFPGKVIFWITPPPAAGRSVSNAEKFGIITKICKRHYIPFLDITNSFRGIDPDIPSLKEMYIPDGLHPNELCHSIYADIVQRYIDNNYNI